MRIAGVLFGMLGPALGGTRATGTWERGPSQVSAGDPVLVLYWSSIAPLLFLYCSSIVQGFYARLLLRSSSVLLHPASRRPPAPNQATERDDATVNEAAVLINQTDLMLAGGNFQGLEGVIRPPERRAVPVHVGMPRMIIGLGHDYDSRRGCFHFNPQTVARKLP